MCNIFRKFFRRDTRSELPKIVLSEDIKRDFQKTFNILMEEDNRREREGLPPRVKRYGSY